MTEYYPRAIASQVLSALENMPVAIVTGMRQTGKSTFLQLQKEFQDRRYITFDDFEYLDAAKRDPVTFLEEEVRTYQNITIDEVQKCPEVLNVIKRVVDKGRKPGQFLLSGSANFALLKSVTETLAGRSIYFHMHPFTRREINKTTGEKTFLQLLFETGQVSSTKQIVPVNIEEVGTGGMPSVCLAEVKRKEIWFKGYEQTYLERDVRDLSQMVNLISFRNLLHLAAMRTGQILSVSQLGRDAKLNTATTSRYLSLFEASFVIYRLQAYLNNRTSRLIKSPKLYFQDSGLATFLGGTQFIKGALFETYMAQNLYGILENDLPSGTLFFWNVQGRHEVDFIIEANHVCVAIEAKDTLKWDAHDLSGLKAFLETAPHCIAGILAYNGKETVKLGDRLWAAPAGLIIS